MLCRIVGYRALAFVAVLSGPCCTTSAQPPAGAAASARCQVWQRELSFARSVAVHDAAAFREHLHADAVFGASRSQQTRGPDAIAGRWAAIVEGKALTIEWYPAQTTESRDVPGIAWSAGPSLVIEQPGTGQARYSIGAYHSVWHRGEDGIWRVLFDDGTEAKPADEAEVRAFRAARREACPGPVAELAIPRPDATP
jgi:ketosteroid isomerase-like protein